jgi:hypothetical protein
MAALRSIYSAFDLVTVNNETLELSMRNFVWRRTINIRKENGHEAEIGVYLKVTGTRCPSQTPEG